MIFTFTEADFGMDKIFHGYDGIDLDPNKWMSAIPSAAFEQALPFDDALMQLYKYGKTVAGEKLNGLSYIATKYFYNNVTAARMALGEFASTVGFLRSDFNNISNAFIQNASDMVLKIINITNTIINSDLFQRGMDALGAIPIVGWIIKIIAKVAEMVYRLVDYILKNKIKNARLELQNQPSIPLVSFNRDSDQELTRICLEAIKDKNMDYLFSPRTIWNDMADFKVVREKRNPNQSLTDFYNIRSLEYSEGAGFIPGTMYLTNNIRLSTRAHNDVLDSGEMYPTPRNLCNQMYNVVQKEGPSLYSVNPIKLRDLWETNILMLLEYAEESVKKGWSAIPTSCIPEIEACPSNSQYFVCSEEIVGHNFSGCTKKMQIGNHVTKFPSTGHYGALRNYIANTYFKGGTFISKNGKFTASDIDISKSLPSKALESLQERQILALDNINCAYIAPSSAFPAIKNIVNNKKKWEKNINLVLDSQEWKKLNWRDIADPEIKEIVAQKATKEKLEYNKDGPIVESKMGLAIPSVLPNPKVPKPFNPIPPGFKLNAEHVKKKSTNGSSSAVPLGAGLGVLAYLWTKR